MSDATQPVSIRDDDGALSQDFLNEISAAIEAGEAAPVRRLVAGLHEADLADLIEVLAKDDRSALLGLLGSRIDVEALAELDEPVRDEVIDQLPQATLTRAVRELDSDDAIYLLEDMDESDQQEILARIPKPERQALERSLDYPEDSAGRLMQSDFVAVPSFWTVGQTIDYMRTCDDLPSEFYAVFAIDPGYHPIGVVALSRLLRSRRPEKVEDIMEPDMPVLATGRDQEDVAREFQRYNLLSAPVVDDDGRMVGVITVDDVVDVIEEEAGEDLQKLGGVGNETVFDTLWDTVRGRFVWLLVNLATAVLASIAISIFDATIEQMVALAVLMPVVASMGGNAGTQTMTVAVRALATRELVSFNVNRVINRETLVGFINGLLFALIVAAIAYVWFGNAKLSGVIAGAMTINMLVAGLSGILIPIAIDKMGLDPALSSSVFLTTVTDIVGFVTFLGFAAIWLL